MKTPKKVLLPKVIKQVITTTEITNTKLRHRISYSILSEMHTTNAYNIQDQQEEDAIFQLKSQKDSFTIDFADNIDRKEETLSGINNFMIAVFYF